MNNKELISDIAIKMNLSKSEVQDLMDNFLDCCVSQLQEGKSIGLQGFGAFEVIKREERIAVHSQTKERSLIPPKLVLNFKQSHILKEKINSNL